MLRSKQRSLVQIVETHGPSSDPSATTLTLITPCFNAVATIADTLGSVVALSKQLWSQGLSLEHLVIDGGSEDGTLQLVNQYRQQVSYCSVITSVAGGPYPAMNAGLVRARGVYTHILNADDMIWDGDNYAALLARGLQTGASLMLGSIAYFRRPSRRLSSVWRVDALPESHEQWMAQIRRGLHYPHPGFICRTDIYQATGFDTSYSLSADYKLMQAVLLSLNPAAGVCTSDLPIVAMAKGGVSGGWRSVLKGRSEIRQINRELGIECSAWRRYGPKLMGRYLGPCWQRFRPGCHQG